MLSRIDLRFFAMPVVCGLYGMAVGFAIDAFAELRPSINTTFPALPGAVLAGFVVAKLFGRPGRVGWGMALLGAVLATLLGSFLAVCVIGFAELAPLGPIYVVQGLVAHPIVMLLWLAGAAAMHLTAKRLQKTWPRGRSAT